MNSNIQQQLEGLDVETLDLYEKKIFDKHFQNMTKAEALMIIINDVDGDFSQLSEQLASIAEQIQFSPEAMDTTVGLKIGLLNAFIRFTDSGSVEKVSWIRDKDMKIHCTVVPFIANNETIEQLKKAPYQEMFIHNKQ